jgi:hypothetical protein
MRHSRIGFTAFANNLSTENLEFNADENDPPAGNSAALAWLDYLRRLVAVGCYHVQFLPPDTVSDAAALGRIAKRAGVREASVLYCTFNPVCPCADSEAAFQKFTEVFYAAKALMAPFHGTKRIFSPSFLRGLMDTNRGLAGDNDRENQIAFVLRAHSFLKGENRGEGFELVIEPLNRFESRGPNTIAATVDIIKDAHAAQAVKVGVDSFHSFMECGGNIARLWTEYAHHIGLIHASALGRGHFWENGEWMRPIFGDIARNKAFNDIPIVIEAFCCETNPAFFSILGIHEVSASSAAEMAAGTVTCLRSWMQ